MTARDAVEVNTSRDDDDFAASQVFKKPPARAWAVSLVAHVAVFGALGTVGTYLGVKAGVIPPTVLEFDAPPPRRPPPSVNRIALPA